jgi:S-methylmethionine-dependent homocysteine/selenocysteine methylase
MKAANGGKRELIIFDGGTGREIQRRGGPFRQPEWSALALYEDPDIIREIHEAYMEAGATAVTTNTYAVVPFHLGKERYQRDGPRLLKLAVDLALQAKGDRENILILGSIPPICGSYEPDSFDEAVAGPIIQDFLAAFRDTVDVLLLETVGSVREAEFYLKAIQAADLKLPVWLSFCMKTEHGLGKPPHLLTGDSLTQAVKCLTDKGLLQPENVPVMLVNCCDIRLVGDSMRELRSVTAPEVCIGAYPNAFSIPPPNAANHTLRPVDFNITPEVLKINAGRWIEEGASVFGGCCGVEPDHIRALSNLREHYRSIECRPVMAAPSIQEKHLG